MDLGEREEEVGDMEGGKNGGIENKTIKGTS